MLNILPTIYEQNDESLTREEKENKISNINYNSTTKNFIVNKQPKYLF